MRFDLTDLRLFVHVAEAASITHGASRTRLALASASARITGMEKALGTALLRRGRRGVQTTPAGQALLHHARIVLRQVQQMRGEISAYSSGLKGHVRLWSNTAALSELLPDALAPFMARHRHVDIDVEEHPSYAIAQAVADGRADIGIVTDTADLSGLETLPFAVDRLVLVAPHGHAVARLKALAFRDVAHEEFVGLSPDSPLQDYIGRHAARAGGPLKQRIHLRDFDAICRMVAGGVGLGVVPQTAARRSRRSLPIATVGLTDPWALRRLTICVRQLDALPVHARDLVGHLRAAGTAA